jgi:hypothetical protein
VTQDHDQTNNCLRSQWQVTLYFGQSSLKSLVLESL